MSFIINILIYLLTFVSVIMRAHASLFRRFTDTNVYKTCSVEIYEKLAKNILRYTDIFLQCGVDFRRVTSGLDEANPSDI